MEALMLNRYRKYASQLPYMVRLANRLYAVSADKHRLVPMGYATPPEGVLLCRQPRRLRT